MQEKLTCLENSNQDLENQKSYLDDLVSKLNERNGNLETELRNMGCEKEVTEEKVARLHVNILALEDSLKDRDNEVCQLIVVYGFFQC
jgi:peptidoglycan hydrolase CwlO-like protein